VLRLYFRTLRTTTARRRARNEEECHGNGGGEHDRSWLEEVVHIAKDVGRPLFSWGFDPIVGR
jgi:hypothetical protein